jgi:hypothetical protein
MTCGNRDALTDDQIVCWRIRRFPTSPASYFGPPPLRFAVRKPTYPGLKTVTDRTLQRSGLFPVNVHKPSMGCKADPARSMLEDTQPPRRFSRRQADGVPGRGLGPLSTSSRLGKPLASASCGNETQPYRGYEFGPVIWPHRYMIRRFSRTFSAAPLTDSNPDPWGKVSRAQTS